MTDSDWMDESDFSDFQNQIDSFWSNVVYFESEEEKLWRRRRGTKLVADRLEDMNEGDRKEALELLLSCGAEWGPGGLAGNAELMTEMRERGVLDE